MNELLTDVLDRADREPRKARRLRLLAAACLETVRDVNADVCERIDSIIKDRLVPPRSKKETMSLATIGHRVLRYLPASLEELSDAMAVATVRSAVLVASPEAMTKLAGYAGDPRRSVQEALIDAWLNFDLQRYAEDVLASAPLMHGVAKIESIRLLPHLVLLQHLIGVEVRLPQTETLPSLSLIEDLPPLHYISAWMRGEIDLKPLEQTMPRTIYLNGHPRRYTNIECLPMTPTSLGLYQREKWRSLEYLRGRSVEHLHVSEVAPDCDLSPLTEVSGLRGLYCLNWSDPEILSSLSDLRILALMGSKTADVRPLRDRSLTLLLSRKGTYIGVDDLGPDVEIDWLN